MTMARLRNLTTGEVVAENVERAHSWWRRLSGLLPYRTISRNDGLWFDHCSAIHTLGMRETIDAIFLDADRRVIAIRHRVPPHQLIVGKVGASAIVELGAAEPGTRNVSAGDQLALE
jgi:uncharacterized protein